jgi:hypothetical protein
MVGDILAVGRVILDKLFPNKAERQQYEIKLLELEQQGEFKSEELRYSAINTEAKSEDKITSRARPMFLYVMYAIILSAIPMGVLNAFEPKIAADITIGFKAWIDAIPGDMWALFGVGYLGYSGLRTYDKKIGAK